MGQRLAGGRRLRAMPTQGRRGLHGQRAPFPELLLFWAKFPAERHCLAVYCQKHEFRSASDYSEVHDREEERGFHEGRGYFQQVQNGIPTGLALESDAPVFLHNGRGLGAYTHVDVLYQAYFIAYLVLNTLQAPLNPGNPYQGSRTQNGFGTFGQPDIAGTLAAVAGLALNAVWFQKWWIHLRHRPESGGAIVFSSPDG